MNNEDIKSLCLKHGGQFHGPNVEHLSIPESALPGLFAELQAATAEECAKVCDGKMRDWTDGPIKRQIGNCAESIRFKYQDQTTSGEK